MNTRSHFTLTVTMLAAASILSACGGGSEAAKSPTTTCAGGRPGSSTPTYTVLGVTGAQLGSYSRDVGTVLAAGSAHRARVLVSGVGSTAAPSMTADVVLRGAGNNDLLRRTDAACKTARVRKAVRSLQESTTTKQTDIVDALSKLADGLKGNPSRKPVDVVILSSMLNVSPALNQSKADVLSDPVGAVNKLAARGKIPSSTHWHIYGVTGDGDTATDNNLREFWRLYAEKAGGQLVAWTPHLAQFPITGAVSAADTSPLTVQRSEHQIVATLSGDVLFDPDAAILRSTAAEQLSKVLALAKEGGGAITVTGYTDVGGNRGSSYRLGLARAATVRQWLIGKGIDGSRVTAASKGLTRPKYAHPATPQQHQANRRVVVIIHRG